MASSHPSRAKLGSYIVLAGLWMQILIFGFFIMVSRVFHRRLAALPTTRSRDPLLPWEKFLYVLYGTSTFIMLRSIARVAELVEGFEGNIIRHEVYLYCFDAVPMAAVMIAFNLWYPANFSRGTEDAKAEGIGADTVVELADSKM